MSPTLNQTKILFLCPDAAAAGNPLLSVFDEQSIIPVSPKTQAEIPVILERLNPELVVLNHSGVLSASKDLLKSLKDWKHSLPVILLVEEQHEEDALELLSLGAEDYIFRDRPARLSLLVNRLQRSSRERNDSLRGASFIDSPAKFSKLIEQSADAIIIINSGGSCTYASSSIKNVLGFSAEEALEVSFFSLVHPADQHFIEDEMSACLEMPCIPVHGLPIRVTDKFGKTRWIEVSFTNLIADPDINGIVANFRDLTRYKIAESSSKENQERYRSFFENSPDAVLLAVTGGEILAANPAAEEMFGMAENEIISIGQTGLMDMEDPRLLPAIREREVKGRVRAEITFRRKGGDKFEGEINSSVFKDASGNDRTSIIIRDISQKKQAEDDLRRSEKNYRNLFQFNPLPSLIYEEESLEILEVNEAALQLYGYSRGRMLGMKTTQLRRKEDQEQLLQHLREIESLEGVVKSSDVVHVKKDGSLLQVEISSHRLHFRKKKCRLAVINDVTQREAVLSELEEKKNKLMAAQKVAKLGYWELELENNVLFWSDQVYKIWEKDQSCFSPTIDFFLNSIHPDSRHLFSGELGERPTGEMVHDVEYQIILESGSIKWIRAKGSIKLGKEGKPVSFGGTLQDITVQKEAQEKLRLSEARHRAILMSQTNYLIRTDLQGRYTYCNQKFRTDFGWIHPDKNILGEDALSSVKEYHRDRVIGVFLECIDNPEKVFQVEIDKLQPGAGEKVTLWDMVCLTNDQGDPVEVQLVGIDITERVKAQQSLQESQARYEIISKATSDAVYDWNLKTGRVEWSEGYKTLFGYETDSSITKWAEHLHPGESEQVVKSLREAIAGGGDSWSAEYSFKKADGEFSIVLEQGTIIRDDTHKPIRMVGAIKDITEKKKYQESLKKKEANLRTAQKIARFGYWELDLKDYSLFWSDYAFRIWEQDEEKGFPLFEDLMKMIHPEDKERFDRELKLALQTGAEHNIEHRIITSNQGVKWLHQRGKTVFDRKGRPVKMEGTVQDITERKVADLKLLRLNEDLKTYTEELIAANKGLEQYSYIVSHNLRSPVANIKGLANLIKTGEYEEIVKSQLLSELYANVERLDNVIVDLSTILQLKKKIVEKKEPVELEQLVSSIQASIKNEIEKEDVKIVTDFSQLGEIKTVVSYMHSIFFNLITNSIKYRRPGVPPVISITSFPEGNDLNLLFKDNGLGFDLEKKRDQVFGLYKRFHNHVEGKGMGLFMVKTQVETLGGTIELKSIPGEGTEFLLRFKKD